MTESKLSIRVEIFDTCSCSEIVKAIKTINSSIDIYCWYEGTQGLPSVGAEFIKSELLIPLHKSKTVVSTFLYSLKGWDFQKTVQKLSSTTPLGDAIQQLNMSMISCLYARDFFTFCIENKNKQNQLYKYVQETLAQKLWLASISKNQKPMGNW